MDGMDIAGAAMKMSQTQLMNEVSMRVLDMTMESAAGMKTEVAMLMESAEAVSVPGVGENIDLKL